MDDTQMRRSVTKYLNEYYGFPPHLETELQQQTGALNAKVLKELDAYVDRCIANREEPELKAKTIKISPRAGAEERISPRGGVEDRPNPGGGSEDRPVPLDARSRYVLFQLIKKVTATRLAAISESARADKTVDVNQLMKALSAREKVPAAEIAKELKPLLGSKPTVDVAARALVGLDLTPAQGGRTTQGYWGYVCRNRCCFWGWRCSWGCLLIGCRLWA